MRRHALKEYKAIMYQQKPETINSADKRAMLLKKYKEKLAYAEVLPLVNKEMLVKEPTKTEESNFMQPKSMQRGLLKFRILLASIFFIGILMLGSNGKIAGKIGVSELKEIIGQTADIGFLTNVFDFMEGFTYTLNDF